MPNRRAGRGTLQPHAAVGPQLRPRPHHVVQVSVGLILDGRACGPQAAGRKRSNTPRLCRGRLLCRVRRQGHDGRVRHPRGRHVAADALSYGARVQHPRPARLPGRHDADLRKTPPSGRLRNELVVVKALPVILAWMRWTKRMRRAAGVVHRSPAGPKPAYLVLVNSFFGLEVPKDLPPLIAPVGPILADDYPPLSAPFANFHQQHDRTMYVAFGHTHCASHSHLAQDPARPRPRPGCRSHQRGHLVHWPVTTPDVLTAQPRLHAPDQRGALPRHLRTHAGLLLRPAVQQRPSRCRWRRSPAGQGCL